MFQPHRISYFGDNSLEGMAKDRISSLKLVLTGEKIHLDEAEITIILNQYDYYKIVFYIYKKSDIKTLMQISFLGLTS